MRSWVTEKEVLGKVEHYKKAGLWELEQERIKLWKVRDHPRPSSTRTRTRTRTADDVGRMLCVCRGAGVPSSRGADGLGAGHCGPILPPPRRRRPTPAQGLPFAPSCVWPHLARLTSGIVGGATNRT
jgi:hypothetical protein